MQRLCTESTMGRRCSHCRHNGHNSRTCITPKTTAGDTSCAGVKLFGVQLCAPPMLIGIECLTSSSSPSSSSSSSHVSINQRKTSPCCISETGHMQERCNKKGVQWTEDEHKAFLIGLERLGKGDWRGISRNFVTTRTSTQVASHAQKYFLRLNNLNKKQQHQSTLLDVIDGRNAHIGNLLRNNTNIGSIDLNSMGEETQVSWHLSLMPNPNSSSLTVSRVHPPKPDLELSISSFFADKNKVRMRMAL